MTDAPEAGKVYALTGGPDTPSIANGNKWAESEVTKHDHAEASAAIERGDAHAGEFMECGIDGCTGPVPDPFYGLDHPHTGPNGESGNGAKQR